MASCPPIEAPQVEVLFGAEKPVYIENATTKALTEELRGNKDSTFALDSRWMVGGATTSIVSGSKYHIRYTTLTDETGAQCVYINEVIFSVIYQPAIFIAAEHLDKPCYYGVVKAHEEQHVAIDIKTIGEYLPKVKMDMLLYLRSLGYWGYGPYTPADAKKQQGLLSKQIVAASNPMLEKLMEARRARQGEIDTEENYRRESAKCPDDFPKR